MIRSFFDYIFSKILIRSVRRTVLVYISGMSAIGWI